MKVSERTAGVEYAIRDIITRARAYEKKNGKNLVTNGVSEALDMTLASVVSPGDEILMPGPHYPPYASYAKFYGGKPVEFKIHPDGKPDIDDSKSKINSKTSTICLAHQYLNISKTKFPFVSIFF